jgi:flagellar motor component MotA
MLDGIVAIFTAIILSFYVKDMHGGGLHALSSAGVYLLVVVGIALALFGGIFVTSMGHPYRALRNLWKMKRVLHRLPRPAIVAIMQASGIEEEKP